MYVLYYPHKAPGGVRSGMNLLLHDTGKRKGTPQKFQTELEATQVAISNGWKKHLVVRAGGSR